MDSKNILDNITRGEDGDVLRLIPNIGMHGERMDNIVKADFIYLQNKKTGKSYFFCDDEDFPIVDAINSQFRENKGNITEVKDIEVNYSRKYYVNVIDESLKVKIFQFGRTILQKINDYNTNKQIFNPADGLGIRISKSEVSISSGQVFPSYDDTKIVELSPYSIGNDSTSVKSFIMNNRQVSIEEFLKMRSWYTGANSRREIIESLSLFGDDLKEYMKKYTREYIIDDLLSDGG